MCECVCHTRRQCGDTISTYFHFEFAIISFSFFELLLLVGGTSGYTWTVPNSCHSKGGVGKRTFSLFILHLVFKVNLELYDCRVGIDSATNCLSSVLF